MTPHPIVVGVSGASGAPYLVRLLETLAKAGLEIHLTISPSGAKVIEQELGITIDIKHFHVAQLLPRTVAADSSRQSSSIVYHHYQDFMAPIASGSFLTAGMVVCPCSGGTLSAIACGASSNLIHRAADVHLKEGRKLVLVPRETPLSLIHLDNMRRAAEAGAVIAPASPGWYHGVNSVDDLINFVVARILDQLQVSHSLVKRWGADG